MHLPIQFERSGRLTCNKYLCVSNTAQGPITNGIYTLNDKLVGTNSINMKRENVNCIETQFYQIDGSQLIWPKFVDAIRILFFANRKFFFSKTKKVGKTKNRKCIDQLE